MYGKKLLVGVLLVMIYLCLLPPEASAGGDWPMFRQNLNNTGAVIDVGLVNSAIFLWNYTTGDPIYSSPSVVEGYVFFCSRDSNIYCLNASTGQKLWNFSTGDEIFSSPAVSGGLLYVASNDGWFYCLNTSTGMPLWIKWLGWNANSCPAVEGDRVFVGSGNHDVVCFNASSGAEIWRYKTADWVQSSPAISNGVLYIASNDFHIRAINASTGAELWKTHTGTAFGSPAVCDDSLYTGSCDGYLFCLDAHDGSIRWGYRTEEAVSSTPAVANGYVYFGSQDNSVYCLNASTGEEIWRTETGFWVFSSPAVAYGCVFVGSEDYNLYCLNASTGTVLWTYATGNQVVSSPAVADGKLYVGSFDCNLYAFSLCNSTGKPVTVASTPQLGWTTIVFNVIALMVASCVVFLVANHMRSVWENRKLPPNSLMPKNANWLLRHSDALCISIIAAFTVALYLNLDSGVLWAADEQTYSQMAYYMTKTGDYLNPHGFGVLAIWAGKPPLVMWLMALSYQVFGVTGFASRFFIPIFGALALLFLYFLGKKLYNRTVGFLSVLILGTFSTFYLFSTRAMTDVPLVCLILGSFYYFLLSKEKNASRWYAPLSGVLFGLAFLTKQTGALLIPAILVLYLVFSHRSFTPLFTKRFGLFFAAALLVVAPWLIYMTASYGFYFWDSYFLYSTFTRLTSPIEGHMHGYLYYFEYFASSEMLLWVVLLPFAVGLSVYFGFKRSKPDILLITWIAVVLAVFTLAQTKISYYILPAYPAFALAIASMLYRIGHLTKNRLRR
jgi:outer membrane protein assembly factor BamB